MTAYRRFRGKPFWYKLLGCAERCRIKLASMAPQDISDRCIQGVYIGRDQMTGQHTLRDFEKTEVRKA